MAAKQGDDVFRFARAHQSGVDKNAGELVADRFVDQHRGDRGIHAARQSADHAPVAHLMADARDGLVAERLHAPFRRDAGDVLHEVAQERCAARGMNDFGMKHHAVEFARLVGDDREGRRVRARDDAEAFGDRGDLVAMAHPDIVAGAQRPDALEQGTLSGDFDGGAAEFALGGGLHLAPQLRHHRLVAVADAEHRNPELENRLRRARGVGLGDACGAAGEDDRPRR